MINKKLVTIQNIRGHKINVHNKPLEIDEIRENVELTNEVKTLIRQKYVKVIEK